MGLSWVLTSALAVSTAAVGLGGTPAAASTSGTIGIGSGMCLTGAAVGGDAAIQSCDGSSPQSWAYDPASGEISEGGTCLAVAGGSDALGTLAVGMACSGTAEQQWVLRPGGLIMSAKSSACLATTAGALTAGTTVEIQTCTLGQAAQTWTTSIGVPVGYTITGTAATQFPYQYDTPAMSFLDKDGSFYFQESFSNYPATSAHDWLFYSGQNFDSVTKAAISNTADNANTINRCNNSPTGLEATSAGPTSSYPEKNYCDLISVWVDPDTGNWYGLVHNEFTGAPFGDGYHFDSIDYAVSTDQGNTWTIQNHAITSPYSTTRGDTTAFPNQTYDYGDGGPRLFTDYASGYFYLYYFSRVVDKSTNATIHNEHVARAPIADKLATGWQKWYGGSWTEPGLGGRESTLIPTTDSGTGFIAPADDYSPGDSGSLTTLINNGQTRETGIYGLYPTWNPYLGEYVANFRDHLYAARDLATERWVDLGAPSGYSNPKGFYQSLVDANKTSEAMTGSQFRMLFNTGGATYPAEYSTITLARSAGTPAPVEPVASGGTYQIAAGNGSVLVQTGTAAAPTLGTGAAATAGTAGNWIFTDNGDGFYTIANADGSLALGVDSTSNAGRAWEATPRLTAPATGTPDFGQEWAIQQGLNTPSGNGSSTGTGSYRLVNRYSGLVLSISSTLTQQVATSPARSWDDSSPTPGGDSRPENAQVLTFPTVSGAHTIANAGMPLVDPAGNTTPGTQLQIWSPNGTTNQQWTTAPRSDGSYEIISVATGLCVANSGVTTPGSKVSVNKCNDSANEHWIVTRLTDGTSTLKSVSSGLLVTTASTSAGALVTQQTDTGSPLQHWSIS